MKKILKRLSLVMIVTALVFTGCKKDQEDENNGGSETPIGELATIITDSVTNINTNSAVCGGNIMSDGGSTVTSRGVCWSTSPNPTIDNNKTTNGSGVGAFTSDITGLTDGSTYYVRAYVTNNKGTAYGEERSFNTLPGINGHAYVDLGLPSGLKWATCNIGATTPEEYGNYYAWGETTTKTSYTQSNSVTYNQQMGNISGNIQYDAARANWGSTWRIPTKEEIEELLSNCSWNWTTQNGVYGYRVTGTNGNKIFLPATGFCYDTSHFHVGENGYYWASTPYSIYINAAYVLYFDNEKHKESYEQRGCGLMVRPVSD